MRKRLAQRQAKKSGKKEDWEATKRAEEHAHEVRRQGAHAPATVQGEACRERQVAGERSKFANSEAKLEARVASRAKDKKEDLHARLEKWRSTRKVMEVQNTFPALDTNRTGSISKEQLGARASKGLPPPPALRPLHLRIRFCPQRCLLLNV